MPDDPTSRRKTDQPFDLLASSLDVPDQKPDLDPMLTLVDAAYAAVQYAHEVSEGARDYQTTVAVSYAQQVFIAITKQGRGGDPYSLEALAAESLELSLLAIRRGLEIKHGLRPPLTEEEWKARVAARKAQPATTPDVSRSAKADPSGPRPWFAALRARLRRTPPEDQWHTARVREVSDMYDLTLTWLQVPDEIRRKVEASQEPLPKPEPNRQSLKGVTSRSVMISEERF